MNITHRPAPKGLHEALIEFDWFTGTGSFVIRATGLGSSPEAAEREARLFIGQARAELTKATTEEVGA